jgi:hypothetical protein
MTVSKSDVFVFFNGEETEKAIEKMRRAIGKKNETRAAVKFAHTVLELAGKRETIENEKERKRFDLLYAFYKIHAVKNQLHDVFHYANELTGKIYNEYTSLGGNYLEEASFRTGKTQEDLWDNHYNVKPKPLIDTRKANADEEIIKADENAAASV